MHAFKSLLRLEFQSRYGHSGVGLGTRISQAAPAVLFFGLIYFLYIYAMKIFVEMFHIHELEYEFLLIFVGLIQIILIAFGISSVIKKLYYSGDNELLLRFPVSGEAVFGAKMTFFVITQTVITLAVMLPVFIMFGIETVADYSYYVAMPFVIILSVIVPVSVSNILAIPFMMLDGAVRNKYWSTLIANVLFVAVGFGLYMGVVQAVVNFLKDQSLSFFSDQTLAVLSNILKYFIPFRWFTDLLFAQNLAVSIPCTILVAAALVVLAGFIVKKLYMRTIVGKLEGSTSAYVKDYTVRVKIGTAVGKVRAAVLRLFKQESKAQAVEQGYKALSVVPPNKKRGVVSAVLRREFLDIFRSKNYSFQYLCMAVAAPVMVYFCNRLCISMGEDSIGEVIVPAICLVVMMLFVTIIVSFAGCCVSKEGAEFYLTKISPVQPYVQVLVKVSLYLMVSFASTIVTLIIIIVSGQIRYSYSLVIAGICGMMAIALTCFAVKLDIVKPSFPMGGDGELVNGNFSTFIAMAVGFVLAIGCGIFGIVGIYMWGVGFTLGMIAVVIGAFMIGSVCWLLIGIAKSYEKIMQR